MDNDIKNKKVLILGFSKTGVACAEYFLKNGCKVYISENGEKKPQDCEKIQRLMNLGAKIEFNTHSESFIKDAAFCILSPSIPPEAPVLKLLKENNIEYFSDIEYLSRLNPEKIILITGTNGKTTTTALTSHILSSKFHAPACGNIGESPLKYIEENPDYYTVEASSFQLYYSKKIKPKIAIFTNLTPDHLLWHKTLENYFDSKAKPFYNMDENDCAILNYDDEKTKNLGEKIKAKVYYFSLFEQNLKNCIYLKNNKILFNGDEIIDISKLKIVGPHNIQNAMCAILAAISLDIEKDKIVQKLETFKAIEHRLEYIRTIEETDYYNDSKATNPEASIVAINSFKGKKVVLIAGGRDKKTTLKEFVDVVKKNISKVILIGEATERFKDELSKSGYINIVNSKTLEEAIDIASLDRPDVVLLSPACASFDMFESYEKRGEAFKNYVLSKK